MKKLTIMKFALLASLFVCSVAAFAVDAPVLVDKSACNAAQCEITNYDASLTYTCSVTGGVTVVQTGNTVKVDGLPQRGVPYTITVTAEDATGQQASASVEVMRFAPVVAADVTPHTGCDNPVQFTIDNYDSNNTYIITPSAPTTVSYTQTGATIALDDTPTDGTTYRIRVTVSDGCTTANTTAQQTYTPTPAQPVVVTTATCGSLKFAVQSPQTGTTYACSVNNGPTSVLTGGVHTITSGNNGDSYEVAITANRAGCNSTPAILQANFITTPETPQITAGSGCNKPVSFTLDNYNSLYTYQWEMTTWYNGVTNTQVLSLPDGTTSYTVTNPVNKARYTLRVTANIALPSGNTCSATGSATQEYLQLPPAPRTTAYANCQQSGTQSWESLVTYDVANGNTLKWYDMNGDPMLIIPTDFDKDLVQNTSYQVTQVTPDGCESPMATVSVRVEQIPQAFAGDDMYVCSGEQATLAVGTTANPNFTYAWSPAGNFVDATVASPTLRAFTVLSDTPYTYTLTVKNANMPQCSSTDEVQVTVLALPQVQFAETSMGSMAVCEGTQATVTIQTEPGISYNWVDNNGVLANQMPTSALTNPITATATIGVEATRDNGYVVCTSPIKTLTFTKVDNPSFNASPVPGETRISICHGNTVLLGSDRGNAITTYEWTPATGLSNAHIAQPSLTVTQTQLYTVKATLRQAPFCYTESSVWVEAAELPFVYDVTLQGNDTYCDGNVATGSGVRLSGSDTGVDYILCRGNSEYITEAGTGGPISWGNLEAGTYTVKARKQSASSAGRCEQQMNGSVTIQAKTSPSVTISNSSIVACPGDEANVMFRFVGDAPFSAEILVNGVSQVINTATNLHTMTFSLIQPTLIQVVQIMDQNCQRIYDPTIGDPYPELNLNVVNMEDFQIECSDHRPQICPGDPVTLSIRYTPSAYPDARVKWSSGDENISSITDYPAEDKTYTVYVETENGTCNFTDDYTVHVAQLTQIEIQGLKNEYCSSDPDDELTGIPANGMFSSSTPGLMQGDFLIPSAITESGLHEITYTVDNMGCTQSITKEVPINMVPEVDWGMYPSLMPVPADEVAYQYCIPNPSQLDRSYKLQGTPQDPTHQWSVHVANGVTTGVSIQTIGDPSQSIGKIDGVTATTYYITYSIEDPSTGCSAAKTKTLTLRNDPQTIVDGGNLIITNSNGLEAPGNKLCLSDPSATLQTSNQVTIKEVKFSSQNISLPLAQQTDKGIGKWYIDPSKAETAGAQRVIVTYEDANGCPSKQEFGLEIVRPVTVRPFELENSYCTYDPDFPIIITSDKPTIGHVKVFRMNGDVVLQEVLSMTDVGTPPYFTPNAWGPGEYMVTYTYSDPDKVCVEEFSQRTTVYAPDVLTLGLESDYCKSEEVALASLPEGGIYSVGANTPAGSIINNTFLTEVAGIGQHTITYTYTNDHGCTSQESKQVYVHGTENMNIFGLQDRYCSPQGEVVIDGYPVDNGTGTFSGCEHLTFIEPAVDASGNPINGKAVIDLSQGNYNAFYTVTYTYEEGYTDAAGNPQTCKSTFDKQFQILNEGIDFGGYQENMIICGYEQNIPIAANKTENVSFTFSHPAYGAFTDNGDGTAVLNPSLLPEGVYSVTAHHQYIEQDAAGNDVVVCESSKTKAFTIENIQQIADMSVFCSPNNENAVRLHGTEANIQYELMVNGVLFNTQTGTGGDLDFPEIVLPHAEVQVVGVIEGCRVEMTEAITVDKLVADVAKTDITCFGLVNGKLTSTVTGGGTPYVEQYTHVPTGTVYANGSIQNLPQGEYQYKVTDQYGCYREITKTINEPLELQYTLQYRDANCFGETTGVASVSPVSGTGVPPYQYTWYNIDANPAVEIAQGVSEVDNLSSGNYKMVITDNNQCFKEETFKIEAPIPLDITLDSKTDVLHTGQAEGSITVNAVGGVPFEDATTGALYYEYTWTGRSFNPPVTVQEGSPATQSNLLADNYYVSVKDARGCTTALLPPVAITEPTALTVAETITPVTCYGLSNGSIRIGQISGGVEPYSYTWTLPDGSTLLQRDITGMPAGSYVFELKDANSNVFTRTYQILQPAAPLVIEKDITSQTDLSCFGDADAKIDITVSGGTAPYTILWSGLTDETTQLSADKRQATNLTAGMYSIAVTDANNCLFELNNVAVTQPAQALSLTAQVTPVKCHGDTDGAIDITVIGGTAPYTYQWLSGIDAAHVNDEDQANLPAGSYTLKVTDASPKQCSLEQTFEIYNPAAFAIQVDTTPISCHNANNGALQVTATGGEGTITYAWTNGAGTSLGNYTLLENLPEETYTVVAKDALGCERSQSVSLSNPDALQVTIKATHITCNGDQNGTLSIETISGGSGQYQYSWEDVSTGTEMATTSSVTHLGPGIYRLKITDAASANCFAWSNEVTINEPLPLAVTYVKDDVLIHGEATGQIKVEADPATGTSPYTYRWLSGASINDTNRDLAHITGLLADNYRVQVTDANGCINADVIIPVLQPEMLDVEVAVTPVMCFGDATGKLAITSVAGGNGTYAYLWTWPDGTTTSSADFINNVPAGDYQLIVTDTDGNTFTRTYTISQPQAALDVVVVPELSNLSVTCYGLTDGAVQLNITGGTAPYAVAWNDPTILVDPANNTYVSGLAKGAYSVTVTDAQGCTKTLPITIDGPVSPLQITETITEIKCYGDTDGKIEIAVSGENGTLPTDYTYQWVGGSGLVPLAQNQSTLHGGESYTVTVTDAKGCSDSKTFTMATRDPMYLSLSATNLTCFENQTGTLTATVTGGVAPIVHTLTDDAGNAYPSVNGFVQHLTAGNYTYTITDANGCVATQTQEITQPNELTALIDAPTVLCDGVDNGEAYLRIPADAGTLPISSIWYKDGVEIARNQSHLINLGAGKYVVEVTDNNHCTPATTVEHTIKWSDPMHIADVTVVNNTVHGDNSGVIEVDVQGGTTPLKYYWTGTTYTNQGINLNRIDNLYADTYRMLVEDDLGCTIGQDIDVTQPETMRIDYNIQDISCYGEKGAIIIMPDGGYQPYQIEWTSSNGFSLSGSGQSYYEINNLDPGQYVVRVIDRNGNEVSKSFTITERTEITWQLSQRFSKTELDCHGDKTGKLDISVSNGTAPYTITWEGPNVTGRTGYAIENLGTGLYRATITDANGCVPATQLEQAITEPAAPLVITDITITDNTCSGANNAAIDLQVEGGTQPYNYVWTGAGVVGNAQNQSGLRAGDYTVTITDANGCVADGETRSINIIDPVANTATLTGSGDICEGDDVELHLNLSGTAPWTVQYTDGYQQYTQTVTERVSNLVHQPTRNCTFRLLSVIDATGCAATLLGEVVVNVHMVPSLRVLSADTDCCLGEPAYINVLLANEGPWTITYEVDGQTIRDGEFTNVNTQLAITPLSVGSKTYHLTSVANQYCQKEINESFEITAYQYPELAVNIDSHICEPQPLNVALHATGGAPWNIVYYMNNLRYEHQMTTPDDNIVFNAYQATNTFLFESITSGNRCKTVLGREIINTIGMLPKTAVKIEGSNYVCRGSQQTYRTPAIEFADTYEWNLPYGYTIVSGMGSREITVQLADDAVSGEITVNGVNNCGAGGTTSIAVAVDAPIATNGEITSPLYVCENSKQFFLAIEVPVEGATNYQWELPTGYTIVAGQGTRNILVEINEYAQSGTVKVIPQNHCSAAPAIEKYITIRQLPLAEAGIDFTTLNCATSTHLGATVVGGTESTDAWQKWNLVSGAGDIVEIENPNTEVNNLLYGKNQFRWDVYDGYCVNYDTVTVTNNNPGITQPEATDITVCENTVTLRAPAPVFGEGRWILMSGDGEVLTPDANVTDVIDLGTRNVNVFAWEVYSGVCSNSVFVNVTSNSLQALADAGDDGVTTDGTYRLSALYYDNPNVQGTWSVVSGSGDIAEPHNPTTIITNLAPGINTVRWTLKGYDCEAYDEIKVRSADEPVAGFNMSETRGCVPLTVQFDNITIGQADFEWDFGDDRFATLRNPVHTFDKAGIYTIKLTAKGKYKTDVTEKQIEVLPAPTAAFTVSSTQLYIPNAEAHFFNESTQVESYYWDFGDGHSSTEKDPVYTYTEDGEYDITFVVVDGNGCRDTLKYDKYIRVGVDAFIVFPTAFTPNVSQELDGKYSPEERRLDIFYPIARNVEVYHLEIFNQWGNMVFSTDQLEQGWNGYYLGQPAAQGTYVYKAEGRFQDGTSFRKGGSILLIR